jgi:pimeloyl-ACP methyl ester carboxylesterase
MRIYRNALRFAARRAAREAHPPGVGQQHARRPSEEAIPLRSALLILLLTLAASPASQAADLAREERMASELAGTVRDGELRRLQAGGVELLALDTASQTAETRGAVVLLHDRGAHPDWPEVIAPLRVGLPAAGWRTLAIQLPVAAADAPDAAYEALVPEAAQRVAAAVAYLRESGPRQAVVLVGHGLGGRIAAEYLATAPAGSVQAFVAIGLPGGLPAATPPGQSPAQAVVPTLDLFGGRDLDAVRAAAPARLQAARQAGNVAYRQAEIAGADHAFTGMGDTLVARVRAWLHRVVPQGGGAR